MGGFIMLLSEDRKTALQETLVQTWSKKSGQLYGCVGTTTSPHKKENSLRRMAEIEWEEKGVLLVQCEMCFRVYVLGKEFFGFKPAPK